MVTRKRTRGKNPLAEKQDSGQNFKNSSVSDYHPKNKPNLILPKSSTHSNQLMPRNQPKSTSPNRFKKLLLQKIIEYFRSTLNAYSLLSYKWWLPLTMYLINETHSICEREE